MQRIQPKSDKGVLILFGTAVSIVVLLAIIGEWWFASPVDQSIAGPTRPPLRARRVLGRPAPTQMPSSGEPSNTQPESTFTVVNYTKKQDRLERLLPCLHERKLLFAGHSHVVTLGTMLCQALSDFCPANEATENVQFEIAVQRILDGKMVSPTSLLRAFLERQGRYSTRYEMYDTIVMGSGMWDLVFFDSHPYAFYNRTKEAFYQTMHLLPNRNGMLNGTFVVVPLYALREPTWPQRKPCQTPERVFALRNATYAAFFDALDMFRFGTAELLGRPRVANRTKFLIMDLYDYTSSLPPQEFAKDGNHLEEDSRKEVLESFLHEALNCTAYPAAVANRFPQSFFQVFPGQPESDFGGKRWRRPEPGDPWTSHPNCTTPENRDPQ